MAQTHGCPLRKILQINSWPCTGPPADCILNPPLWSCVDRELVPLVIYQITFISFSCRSHSHSVLKKHSSPWSCNSPRCHIRRRASSSLQAEPNSSLQSRAQSWAPLPIPLAEHPRIASWHLSIHPLGRNSQAQLLASMNSSSLPKSAHIFVLF